ncbi:hypothetical protein FV139_17970 [Parahaliea maris]|uniref:Uncharacterized protein n=1 Tax=Parahaliea maris TaxID=2716870 RepID=A0A5C8ZTS2_9GAMM|nr:hypothetical protein [Parahaliea maris]TXS90857.1 hypothetical protein FV139_17970 [Parahaliea maris]
MLLVNLRIRKITAVLLASFVAFGAVAYLTDFLAGTDAKNYFFRATDESYSPYEHFLWKSSLENLSALQYGDVLYPYVVRAVFGGSPGLISSLLPVFLYLFLVLSTFYFARQMRSSGRISRRGSNLALTLCLLSPSLLYFSNIFHKEALCAALTLIAATAWVRKSILLFGASLILLLVLRPYSPAAILIALYVLTYRRIYLQVFWMLLIPQFIIFWPGLIDFLESTGIMMIFTAMAPNPFDVENWRLIDRSITIQLPAAFLLEGLVLSLIVLVGVYAIVKYRLLFLINVYLAIVFLLIYTGVVMFDAFSHDSIIERIAVPRKRVFMIPILYFAFVSTLEQLRTKKRMSSYPSSINIPSTAVSDSKMIS